MARAGHFGARDRLVSSMMALGSRSGWLDVVEGRGLAARKTDPARFRRSRLWRAAPATQDARFAAPDKSAFTSAS
jgi:hypothetical protein